ncbi:MAG: zinc-ribbon domain-containing protein [Deltaproteobacteria bacterium]|nr:zinc-ribbon domain-containing protein [Deltaproteobacteria bacterium]
MKFSCDDCGAQYMIADEKIGPRGVKVRCKKCANVIILRPNKAGSRSLPPDGIGGLPSFPAPPPTELIKERPVAHSVADDEATQAMEARPGPSSQDLSVSSDLGLSEEFAAHGFDLPKAGREPASKGALGLGMEFGGSPFSGASVGGSLGDLARAEALSRPAGLAPGLSQLDDSLEAKTNVDQAPEQGSSAFQDVATRVAPVHIPDEARRPDSDTDEPPTTRAVVPSLGSLARLAGGDGEAELDARLDRLQLGGLPEDSSTLDTLDRSESDLHRPPDHAQPGDSAMSKPETNETATGLGDDLGFDPGSLGTIRDSGSNGEPLPLPMAASSVGSSGLPGIGAARRAAGGGGGGGAGLATAGGENLEDEIGSAFEAVFGSGAGLLGEKDPFDALVRDSEHAANGNGTSAVQRSEQGATEDKKATRVFDGDAMRRLQDEQDLAATKGESEPQAEAVKEWYVAIQDEQVGPLTLTDMQARWDAGDVDANALCWKAGMADWVAIRFVKELESLPSGGSRRAAAPAGDEPRADRPRDRAVAKDVRHDSDPRGTGERLAPLAARGNAPEPEEASEPSWRPNAASALASLAAAELEPSQKDIAIGPAFPVSGSLPPPPAGQATASMFGAKEMTGVRPVTQLPKAPELASSMPLRDPVVARTTPAWLLPTAIGGGAMLLISVLGLLIYLAVRPAAPPVSAPPALAAAPAEAPAPPAPAERPVLAAAAPTEAAAAPAGAAPPPEAAAAAAPSEHPAEAAASPAAAADSEKREKKRREPREASASGTSKKREREREPPPEPPPAPKPSGGPITADDLLGAVKKRPEAAAASESSDLPDQLEDADVLRTLRKHKGDINACRDRQAKADPNLEGVMTVTFVVLKTGRTSQHAVSPDKFRSSVVGKCVIESVKGWKFPQFTGRPLPIDFPVMVKGRG